MTDEQREQRLVYRRKYDEERRIWLDEHGMCHKCGKRKVLEGRKFCPVCIEKNVINCMKKYRKSLRRKGFTTADLTARGEKSCTGKSVKTAYA